MSEGEDGGQVRLCALADIAEGGSAAFRVTVGQTSHDLIAVRKGGRVHAYVNSCPHQGDMLDYPPGRCLDETGMHILCAVHLALFRVEDGYCFDGPCRGESLRAVTTAIESDAVYVRF